MAETPDSMTSVYQDNAKTFASMAAEAEFERKAERYFAGQREIPRGRNFLWNTMRYHDGSVKDSYAIGMCRTFPDAPGSRMCGACSIRECELRRES